jgi:hypothetical protein
MKYLKFIIILQTCIEASFVQEDPIKSCVFHISWKSCKGCNFLSMCSLFELNVWEDEWLVSVKILEEGKRKEERVKKREKMI